MSMNKHTLGFILIIIICISLGYLLAQSIEKTIEGKATHKPLEEIKIVSEEEAKVVQGNITRDLANISKTLEEIESLLR